MRTRYTYFFVRKFQRDRRALSTSISTVILTGSAVVLIIITSIFANTFLNSSIAQNEFATMKQFMQNVSLQVDDIAWIVGRTQTIRYASMYGQLDFAPSTLNYTIQLYDGAKWVPLATYSVGIILFNMSHKAYTISNDYHERLLPSSSSFLQKGVAASVGYVCVVEKIPMPDGNFLRIVVAPTLRMINSTIFTDGVEKTYYKFYLPVLARGFNPRYSQSLTLVGKSISAHIDSGNAIKITATFPKQAQLFDSSFFGFDRLEETVNVPVGSIFELYTSEVTVSLGLYA